MTKSIKKVTNFTHLCGPKERRRNGELRHESGADVHVGQGHYGLQKKQILSLIIEIYLQH